MLNKRKSVKDQIKVKAMILRTAQRRAAQLQAENDWLRWEHQLITEMCKGFDWFRHLKLQALLADPELMMCIDSEQLTPADLQQQLGDSLATEDESRLLRQLSFLPQVQTESSLDAVAELTTALDGSNPLQERCNGSSASMHCGSSVFPASAGSMLPASAGSATSSSNSSISNQPLAPPDDPLWLLKHLLSLPSPACCNNMETMTLQELQALYKSTVHDLSVYLVQHSAGSVTGSTDEPLKKIHAAMTEHLKMIAQLCTARSELVTALQLSNSDTGEQVAEPDTQRIGWVVERLKLSPHQQHSIARGMGVFKRLLSPVLEELRQLQQQVDECTSPCASTSTGFSEGAAACSGDADGQAQQYSSSSARRRMLEQQEQRSARMKMLLRKDYFLRTWFGTYLYGQLSWVQLARMHVLMVPFYPVPFVFFSEVAAQVAANLAKRQEQVDEDTQDDDSPGSTST